jgi:hypothetical protein
MASLMPWPIHEVDFAGKPLAGGILTFYKAGTTTPQDVYDDEGTDLGSSITLDSNGRATPAVCLGAGAYKIECTDANSVLQWQVDNISGGSSSGKSIGIVDIIDGTRDTTGLLSTLRGLAPDAYGVVICKGYWAIGDGGGGSFHWDSTNATTDDGSTYGHGVIIKPASSSGAGRWIRDFDDNVNIRFFGAVGDNSTDDATYIGYAVAYASTTRNLLVPNGTFVMGSSPGLAGRVVFEPFGVLKWSTFNPAMKPIIQPDDDSQHFNCSSADAPVLTGLESVRPEWFGAIGNGTSEDLDHIAACINSVPDQSGVRVEFKPGTEYALIGATGYIMTSRSGLILNGNGAKLKKVTNAGPIFRMQACSHITVNNFIIEGNSLATNGFSFEPVSSVACAKIKFNDVYIEKCTGAAIKMGDWSNDSVEYSLNDSLFVNTEFYTNATSISCNAPYNDNIVFDGVKLTINSAATTDDFLAQAGTLQLRNVNITVNGTPGTSVSSGWVFDVVNGSISVDGGEALISNTKGTIQMAAPGGTYVTNTYYYKQRPSSFRNVKFNAIGTSGYSGISDGLLVSMIGGSRALYLSNSELATAYATTGAFAPTVIIRTANNSGPLISEGNRYSVYNSTSAPWTSVGALNYLRSTGDIFFTVTNVGGGVYTTNDVLQPDRFWCGNGSDIEVGEFVNESLTTTTLAAQYQTWKGQTGTNVPYQVGQLGFLTDSTQDAEFRLYTKTTTALRIDGTQEAFWYGRVSEAAPGTVTVSTSSVEVTLPNCNYVNVTSTGSIASIAFAGWQSGSRVTLLSVAGFTLLYNQTPSTGYAKLVSPGSSNTVASRVIPSGEVVDIIYNGSWWQQVQQPSTKVGDTEAATANLPLLIDGNEYFTITGSADVYMITTGRLGQKISVYFQTSLKLKHNSGSTAGYSKLYLNAHADSVVSNGDIVNFIFDGTYWRVPNAY